MKVISLVLLSNIILCTSLLMPMITTQNISVITPTFDATQFFEEREINEEQFRKLLIENGNCELPCWLGFNIGISRDIEWFDFFENQNLQLSYYPENTQQSGALFFEPLEANEGGDELQIRYIFEDNILSRLSIVIGSPNLWLSDVERYSFGNVLGLFANTPQIYIWGFGRINDYQIVFWDNEMGVIFRYSFDLSNLQASADNPTTNTAFCLSLRHTNQIEMTVQDNTVYTESVGLIIERSLDEDNPEYYSTASLLGIDNEVFAQFFINHPDQCLIVSDLQGANE